MEGDNSDSNSYSIPADSVSSLEQVASTSASAASWPRAPTTPGTLLPSSAAAMNEVPLVPSSQQSTPSSESKSETSMELLQLTPFTPEELIVKPKQMKCPRKFVPDADKDEEYYAKRRKNCEAVRVWRKKNEEKKRRMKIRLAYLESEHKRLDAIMTQQAGERQMMYNECLNLRHRVDSIPTYTENKKMETLPTTESENQNL